MKKFYFLALSALVGIVFSSCSLLGGDKNPEFKLSDLQGLWLQDNDNTEHYVRFTNEASGEAGYLLGREWHEADPAGGVYESDLMKDSVDWGHPTDGWFRYAFKTTGSLHEIHYMTNEGAEQEKFYVVTLLSDTKLEYYEKDRKTNKFYFSKVVENK